jgi:membrane-anchored protein YejM (alkaline phosphatase superfamily)
MNNGGDTITLADAAGREHHQVKYSAGMVKYGAVIAFREEHELDDFLAKTNLGALSIYQHMRDDVLTARPVDEQASFQRPGAPNVIYLVLESFRESAVSPEVMRRLDQWGRAGLRLKHHYAGSNSSHLGLFTLLYGRSPLVYYPTVDAGVPPQTCFSLRKSGYQNTFITSGDCTGFRRMDAFLNEQVFDQVVLENGVDWRDWPDRDRRALARVKQIATERTDRPQFIMAFLMSTHFPYVFPPQFDVHQPSGPEVTKANWSKMDPKLLHNRYRNAALYLESELMGLIESLDPQRNIIVVTGDHGESMSEDGALAHASRGSEVQTRVPLLMVGPGLPPRVIDQPTTHSDVLPTLLHALAGKPISIAHAHGRDVLAAEQLPDQVLVCPYRWKDPYDLVLIRADQRMQFKIRLDRPDVEAFGFCDQAGNLIPNPPHACSLRDATAWVEAFRQELRRIVR